MARCPPPDFDLSARLTAIRRRFLQDLPRRSAEIEAHAERLRAGVDADKAIAAIDREVHMLSGTARTLSMPEIDRLSAEIHAALAESHARGEPALQRWERVAGLVDTLVAATRAVADPD